MYRFCYKALLEIDGRSTSSDIGILVFQRDYCVVLEKNSLHWLQRWLNVKDLKHTHSTFSARMHDNIRGLGTTTWPPIDGQAVNGNDVVGCNIYEAYLGMASER